MPQKDEFPVNIISLRELGVYIIFNIFIKLKRNIKNYR